MSAYDFIAQLMHICLDSADSRIKMVQPRVNNRKRLRHLCTSFLNIPFDHLDIFLTGHGALNKHGQIFNCFNVVFHSLSVALLRTNAMRER
jgi:hypothetical protein